MILFQQDNLGSQILVGFFRFWLEAIECDGGVICVRRGLWREPGILPIRQTA